MSKKQWVCHISGQGEKWEVRNGVKAENAWCVEAKNEHDGYHWLPKSEYCLCDPPEVWRDVTEECCEVVTSFLHPKDLAPVISHKGEHLNQGYRLRKVQLWQSNGLDGKNCPVAAFIVEQKVKS